MLIVEHNQSIYPGHPSYHKGKVHSVYRNVINLLLNDKIVSIQNKNVSKTPLTFLVDTNINFLETGIRQEEDVLFDNEIFFIKNEIFMLVHSKAVSYQLFPNNEIDTGHEEWKEAVFRAVKLYGKYDGLGAIAEYYLISSFNSETKKNFNKLSNIVFSTLEAARIDVQSNDLGKAANLLSSLIGLGIGSTPSGDDFLIGLLSYLSFNSIKDKRIDILYKALVDSITLSKNNTTRLSKEFLVHASQGEFGEIFHKLYRAILMKDNQQIFLTTVEFMKIGHSSGTDSLSGIIYGQRLLDDLLKGYESK